MGRACLRGLETRARVASGETPGVSLKKARAPEPAERPYATRSRAELLQAFETALGAADGVRGAHCVHERTLRRDPAWEIERDRERLWQHAAATIPDWLPMHHVDWLPIAYDIAAGFGAAKRGRSHIYLVLLDNEARRGAVHGVYVGMTSYAPSLRFDQHKSGIRASGAVLKRGLELLSGPVHHLQWISRVDAMRIERELAAALADAGLAVEGGH